MKKTSKKLTTLLTSAILVFGSIAVTSCSNDSDDNTAKILAAASANTNSGTSTTNNNNNNNENNTNNDNNTNNKTTNDDNNNNNNNENNNNNNNNNTNNDNNNTNNNTPVVAQTNKYLFAEAVEGGIQFTIKTLPAKNREVWIGIRDENGTALVPDWKDKAKDWTGLYPFISAGEKRTFTVWLGDTEEKVTVTATGGEGSISIPTTISKPTLTVTTGKITVGIPAEYKPSLIPTGYTAEFLQLEILTEKEKSYVYHATTTNYPPENTSYNFPNNAFTETRKNWKEKYSDKKIHVSIFYHFKNGNDEYRIKYIDSENITPTAWQN